VLSNFVDIRFDILLSRSKGDWLERMFREEFAEAMVMDLLSSDTMKVLQNCSEIEQALTERDELDKGETD
jgi:hypothetical protein